jgi:hypothetical protein
MAGRREPVTVPWAPEDLPVASARLRAWSYVVLEENVDDVCLLRRWGWPVVDQLGRLTWADDDDERTGSLTIDLLVLRAQLYTPNGIERRPRIGDVFGVERSAGAWTGEHVRDLRRVVGGRVFDVSADARLAAKIAYQAGLSTVRPPGREDEPLMGAVRADLQVRAVSELPRLRVIAPPAGRRTDGSGTR